MSVEDFYWLLIAVAGLLLWQFHNIRKLSAYNIKWLIAYLLYAIIMFAWSPVSYGMYDYSYKQRNYFEDDIQEVLIYIILLPLLTYILLPIVLRYIGKWKVVQWIDKVIDSIYMAVKSYW